MKIHQLPMGARFEYEGDEYVKSGPLLATGRNGQRLIPKYALLRPLGDVAAPVAQKLVVVLSGDQVLAAFDAFCAECEPLVPADRRAGLASARAGFLSALGLN